MDANTKIAIIKPPESMKDERGSRKLYITLCMTGSQYGFSIELNLCILDRQSIEKSSGISPGFADQMNIFFSTS